MPDPAFAGVIERVGQPLLLQEPVPLVGQEQWLSSLQVAILFSVRVQVHGSPNTGLLAPDHDDGRRVDGQVDSRSCAACLCMTHSFQCLAGTAAATALPHADQSTAHQTDARLFGMLLAVVADPLVIEQEQLIIGRRQTQESRPLPADRTSAQQFLQSQKEKRHSVIQKRLTNRCILYSPPL